jgi:hypothetical protein
MLVKVRKAHTAQIQGDSGVAADHITCATAPFGPRECCWSSCSDWNEALSLPLSLQQVTPDISAAGCVLCPGSWDAQRAGEEAAYREGCRHCE